MESPGGAGIAGLVCTELASVWGDPLTAKDCAPPARFGVGPDGDRRTFLKSALGALVTPSLAGLALGAGRTPALASGGFGAEAAAPLPFPDPGFVVRRHGAYYLVEGWVLTGADLEALGIDVPVAEVAWAGGVRDHDL